MASGCRAAIRQARGQHTQTLDPTRASRFIQLGSAGLVTSGITDRVILLLDSSISHRTKCGTITGLETVVLVKAKCLTLRLYILPSDLSVSTQSQTSRHGLVPPDVLRVLKHVCLSISWQDRAPSTVLIHTAVTVVQSMVDRPLSRCPVACTHSLATAPCPTCSPLWLASSRPPPMVNLGRPM